MGGGGGGLLVEGNKNLACSFEYFLFVWFILENLRSGWPTLRLKPDENKKHIKSQVGQDHFIIKYVKISYM